MHFIKKYIKNKLQVLALIFVVVSMPFFSGCGSVASGYKVSLEIWGFYDDSSIYKDIIDQYKKINPYIVEITYRNFAQETYKKELLDGLASGQGPDIFLINNSWLPSFKNKIYPAPTQFVSEQAMKSSFPDVVAFDFMSEEKVYAVPLSVDSMVMYYNRDAFNAASIASPPTTWLEFENDINMLTKVDATGNITSSGAAIGTARNVNASPDLMSMLMFQYGVEMPMKQGDSVKFEQGIVDAKGNVVAAGQEALDFYTKFAKLTTANNITNPLYTWNSKQLNSVDAFAGGTTAMMFNYSWQNAEIKNKNPKLNYAVAPVPQLSPASPTTAANYWGYAVSLNKTAPIASDQAAQTAAPVSNDVRMREAWQFLRFLTLKNSGTIRLYNAVTGSTKDFPISFDPASDYLKKTNQPAARRDLIETQKEDVFLGPFAKGNLIAKNWYKADSDAIDLIFASMIESVVYNSAENTREALKLATNRIEALSKSSGMGF